MDDHLADSTRYMLFHLGIPDKPVRAKPWVIRELEKLSGLDRDENLTVRN